MSRVTGPPVTDCPLTPVRVPSSTRDGRKFLAWRLPSGWVVAYGTPIKSTWTGGSFGLWSFEVIVAGLSCWHLAAHVARTTRWDPGSDDPGSPFYRRGGWLGTGVLVPQPLEVSPGVLVCAGCHEALTGGVR